MESDSDATLTAAVAGDADALSRLLERHGPGLRESLERAIPHRLQSIVTADDVLQQTYTDAFLAVRRFAPRGPGAFGAWLASLAQRNLQDAIRWIDAEKRGGARQASGERLDWMFEQAVADSYSPSRALARQEAHTKLRDAIQGLPELHRTVLRLYDLEGRPMTEVAAALNRPLGAVYMLRARAHRWLQETLGGASQFFSHFA